MALAVSPPAPLPVPPPEAARAAGLRHVCDAGPGIRRVRAGRGFRYVAADGRTVADPETLARIRSLAIPPAWTDVWICPDPRGHVQATGRDARGRKQYRYHPKWREVRDATKYHRLLAFGAALPRIRARVEEDLARPGLPREKVLATVVRLLEATCVRVGNQEYARANRSYGLTTLQGKHAEVLGATLALRFRGKSGKEHRVTLKDRRLARIVARCQELPGQDLFQYVDEAGEARSVGSADVNAYLREAAEDDFTAKDFRTWSGTVLAALALEEMGPPESGRAAKRNGVRALERVAAHLGNTPAVCRKAYVHPAVLEAYEEGVLVPRKARAPEGLDPDEARVLALLADRLSSS